MKKRLVSTPLKANAAGLELEVQDLIEKVGGERLFGIGRDAENAANRAAGGAVEYKRVGVHPLAQDGGGYLEFPEPFAEVRLRPCREFGGDHEVKLMVEVHADGPENAIVAAQPDVPPDPVARPQMLAVFQEGLGYLTLFIVDRRGVDRWDHGRGGNPGVTTDRCDETGCRKNESHGGGEWCVVRHCWEIAFGVRVVERAGCRAAKGNQRAGRAAISTRVGGIPPSRSRKAPSFHPQPKLL